MLAVISQLFYFAKQMAKKPHTPKHKHSSARPVMASYVTISSTAANRQARYHIHAFLLRSRNAYRKYCSRINAARASRICICAERDAECEYGMQMALTISTANRMIRNLSCFMTVFFCSIWIACRHSSPSRQVIIRIAGRQEGICSSPVQLYLMGLLSSRGIAVITGAMIPQRIIFAFFGAGRNSFVILSFIISIQRRHYEDSWHAGSTWHFQ